MDEEEILARLKAHVASHQDFSQDEQWPSPSQPSFDSVDIDRLTAEVGASWDAVVRSKGSASKSLVDASNPASSQVDELLAEARLLREIIRQSTAAYAGYLLDVSKSDGFKSERLLVEVRSSRDEVGQLNPRNPGLLNFFAQALKKIIQRSLTWYTRSLQAFHQKVALALELHGSAIKSVEQSLELHGSAIKPIEQSLELHGSAIESLGQSLGLVEHRAESLDQFHQKVALAIELHGSAIKSIAHLYKKLEEQVRQLQNVGPAEAWRESLKAVDLAIQEQQVPYAELFRGLSPVVDIGCGSGGFLELLKHKGIEGYGVDSDQFACHEARRKRVTVVQDDMFHHLRQLSDRSLGGIFSARVIEYLPTHLQMEFISLCSQKVKSGGVVVIETINPESTLGFGRNSYLDPTHLRPVPLELLKSALDTYCFRDIEVCFLAPIRVPMAPTSEPNSNPEYQDRVLPDGFPNLVGAPAYAVVGRRD